VTVHFDAHHSSANSIASHSHHFQLELKLSQPVGFGELGRGATPKAIPHQEPQIHQLVAKKHGVISEKTDMAQEGTFSDLHHIHYFDMDHADGPRRNLGILAAECDNSKSARGEMRSAQLLHRVNSQQTPRRVFAVLFSDIAPIRYIKFLPQEELPTFWNDDERELLAGTTLKPAVDAKLKSLQKEYDRLRSLTEKVPWCAKIWWDEDSGLLTFDDFAQVDAMYRSRALEYPGIGEAMVPCLDMANHTAGQATAAVYETDNRGDAILLLRDGKVLDAGSEVTIT
jgi:hypothetical protein